jgi:hypothetical protein
MCSPICGCWSIRRIPSRRGASSTCRPAASDNASVGAHRAIRRGAAGGFLPACRMALERGVLGAAATRRVLNFVDVAGGAFGQKLEQLPYPELTNELDRGERLRTGVARGRAPRRRASALRNLGAVACRHGRALRARVKPVCMIFSNRWRWSRTSTAMTAASTGSR